MLSSTFRICLESALCAAPHPAGVCNFLQPCGSKIAKPLVSTGGFAVAGPLPTTNVRAPFFGLLRLHSDVRLLRD